jgi:predicted DNA-binding transcriptional regulator YafY
MVDRTVDPYELRSIRGEWYLVGPSRESGYVSLFNVGRIRGIEETGDTFNRDEIDFNADEYFEHSLGASHSKEGKKVKIRFTGWAARYISEREWHPTQKLEETEDGSVELTMKLGWLEEVCSWVLSFGPNAEALEPEELREMVAERLQTTLDIY